MLSTSSVYGAGSVYGNLVRIAEGIREKAKSADYAGFDPFDALNSRLFNFVGLHRIPLARLAWTQLFKRSPLNLRGLALVPRARNPKGVALFILGMLEDFRRTRDRTLLMECQTLATWLVRQRSSDAQWAHACWGYHFDWQARAFFVPAGKPNVVTTAYVAMALAELSELDGDPQWKEVATDAGRFVAKHLFVEDDAGLYIAYIPGESALVHNASLWGAVTAARAAIADGDADSRERVLAVARRTVGAQRSDGAWVYGARAHHQFVDGFHTGFNLEALSRLSEMLETAEFDDSIARGLCYYRDNLFTSDGLAKYYDNAVFPLDMHSFAQAVITFERLGTDADARLTDRIVERAMGALYMEREQRFAYQATRRWRNGVDYIRWTQAWSYYALARFNRKQWEKGNA